MIPAARAMAKAGANASGAPAASSLAKPNGTTPSPGVTGGHRRLLDGQHRARASDRWR